MLTTSFRCKESGFTMVGSPRNYPKTTRSPARSSMVELPDGDCAIYHANSARNSQDEVHFRDIVSMGRGARTLELRR